MKRRTTETLVRTALALACVAALASVPPGARPDITAVVHAHAVALVAFSLTT